MVATDVGGNPELVTADCGRLVPSDSPACLSDAIAGYSRDPQLRAAHGDAARRRIETDFALPVMVDRYHCLYEGLIEGA